uniref:Uncharacterized protein n=1 Tax=Cacopsylla melanoneura TaxID=428564 RepID=A0A8D8X961_9HEMI
MFRPIVRETFSPIVLGEIFSPIVEGTFLPRASLVIGAGPSTRVTRMMTVWPMFRYRVCRSLCQKEARKSNQPSHRPPSKPSLKSLLLPPKTTSETLRTTSETLKTTSETPESTIGKAKTTPATETSLKIG